MGDLGEVGTNVDMFPNLGGTIIELVTASSVVHTDTITVDLGKYGCSTVQGVIGFVETATGSEVTQEDPTTAVSAGTLTLTVTGTAGAKVRTYYIFAQ